MEGFKRYRIWKGWHWCTLLFCIKLLWNCTRMTKKVVFKKSCLYNMSLPDKLDINKLFGFSYGKHHDNSARFGWNCDGDKINLHAYCYLDGKRVDKFITKIDVEEEYKLMISVSKDKYIFTTFIEDEASDLQQVVIPKPQMVPKLGFKLWPYFGGTQKAPHTMDIYMQNEY